MSEDLRRERWGSHWRWGLLAAVVALLGARYVAARSWKNRKLVVHGGGPPALVLSASMHQTAIESWDWNSNQFQTFVELEKRPGVDGTLRAGEKIVWLQGGDLHTVELKPPHARRQWKTPFPFEDRGVSMFALVGTSPNQRLAVVQFQRLVERQPNTYVLDSYELAVIDVDTGEVLSRKNWHSQMRAALEVGEFESNYIRGGKSNILTEPNLGRWRLSDRGEWALTSTTNQNAGGKWISIAKSPDGRRRNLPAGVNPTKDEVVERVALVAQCEEHFLMRTSGFGAERNRLLLGHADTDTIQLLGHHSGENRPRFSDDMKHIVVADTNDDVCVFEAATGRLVASDTAGSFWRRFVHGISAAWLCAAVGWFISSWRQLDISSAIIDLHAAGVTMQMALFGNLLAYSRAGAPWLIALAYGAIFAITVALAMAVGWYWIHGEASMGTRLRQGMISIAVVGIVPACALILYSPLSMAYVALIPPFGGLFVASVTAMILAPFSMTGWRVSDRPIQGRGRGFGLASMMLMIGGTAVVMGFLRLNLVPIIPEALLEIAMFVVPAVLLGVFWPALAMLNISRRWQISLEVATVALIPIAGVARYCVRGWNPWGFDTMPVGFAGVTGIGTLAMILLLHKWGWRWRRASVPEGSPASPEAMA